LQGGITLHGAKASLAAESGENKTDRRQKKGRGGLKLEHSEVEMKRRKKKRRL